MIATVPLRFSEVHCQNPHFKGDLNEGLLYHEHWLQAHIDELLQYKSRAVCLNVGCQCCDFSSKTVSEVKGRDLESLIEN